MNGDASIASATAAAAGAVAAGAVAIALSATTALLFRSPGPWAELNLTSPGPGNARFVLLMNALWKKKTKQLKQTQQHFFLLNTL